MGKNIITEPQQTFKWYLTARHATANWQYFITKPDWNPNLPITREQLILIPFVNMLPLHDQKPLLSTNAYCQKKIVDTK